MRQIASFRSPGRDRARRRATPAGGRVSTTSADQASRSRPPVKAADRTLANRALRFARGPHRRNVRADSDHPRRPPRGGGQPLESVMIRCPAGHCFSRPAESLTPDRRDRGLQRGHDGRAGPPGGLSPPSRSGQLAARTPLPLLPGPPCGPVDHRDGPAPRVRRLRLPDGSRRRR